ncbi:unnamed protein product [Staurois parvus]|uniref:Uncharacterized protein n=1 Tax=Staurois parvus TaxID=386267 RepID=A0ABN9BQH1_9NEOB|nr:unnamed protein product [Staurois parvus]
MYINSRTGVVQERVPIYKRPPIFPACAHSLGECSTVIRCPLCPLDTAEHRTLHRTSVIT